MNRFCVAHRTRSHKTLSGSTTSRLHRSPADIPPPPPPLPPLSYDESLIDAFESRDIRPPPRRSPEISVSSGPRGGRTRGRGRGRGRPSPRFDPTEKRKVDEVPRGGRTRGRGRGRGRGRPSSCFAPTGKRKADEVSVSESAESSGSSSTDTSDSSFRILGTPGEDPVEEVSFDKEVESARVPVATAPLKKVKEEITYTETSSDSDSDDNESPKPHMQRQRMGEVSRRTRVQKGQQGRVSYAEYFDEDVSSSADDYEEEEEEKSDYPSSSKEEVKIYTKKRVPRVRVEEIESSEDEKTEIASRSEREPETGSEDVRVTKSETLSQRGGRDNSVEKSDREATSMSRSSGPAQGTRSRFSSPSTEQTKLGAVCTPICLDEDDKLSEKLTTEELPMNPQNESSISDFPPPIFSFEDGVPKPAEISEQRKVGTVSTPICLDEDEDKKVSKKLTTEEPPMNPQNESSISDFPPLIFSFEDEVPKPAKISEHGKEIDHLWADVELDLDINNIGTYNADQGETEDINGPEEKSGHCSFSKGKHQFILDEQIGIRCKFCSFLVLHIRDIMPAWRSNFGESSARKTSTNANEDVFTSKERS